MASSLKTVLVEWILSNGPTRSPEQIAQCDQEVERIVQKYFGNSDASEPVLEPPTIRF